MDVFFPAVVTTILLFTLSAKESESSRQARLIFLDFSTAFALLTSVEMTKWGVPTVAWGAVMTVGRG